MFGNRGRADWIELVDLGPDELAKRLWQLSADDRRDAEDVLRLVTRLQAALQPGEAPPTFVKQLSTALRFHARHAAAGEEGWWTSGRRWALAATVGASVAGVFAVAWMRREREGQQKPAAGDRPIV